MEAPRLVADVWRWRHIAAGVFFSAALHGGLGFLAAQAPEMVLRPEPRRERVRMVDGPRTPSPAPSVAEPATQPAPLPVALPDLEPLKPTVAPAALAPTVSPATAEQASAAPKRAKKRRKKKRRRAPGRTLTSQKGTSAPASEAPEGRGGALDLGAWDPTAGRGDSSRVPEPAGPGIDRPPVGSPPSADSSSAAPPAPERKVEALVPPRPLSRPSGRYPAGVPRSAGPAVVQLSLQVSATGEVLSATILSGQSDRLNAEARRLALTIKFKPGRRGQVAVAMRVPWRVTFR